MDFEEEKNYKFFNNRRPCPFSSEKASSQKSRISGKTIVTPNDEDEVGLLQPQQIINFSLLHPQYFPSRCLWAKRRRCFSDSLSDLTERSDESLVSSMDYMDLETSYESVADHDKKDY